MNIDIPLNRPKANENLNNPNELVAVPMVVRPMKKEDAQEMESFSHDPVVKNIFDTSKLEINADTKKPSNNKRKNSNEKDKSSSFEMITVNTSQENETEPEFKTTDELVAVPMIVRSMQKSEGQSLSVSPKYLNNPLTFKSLESIKVEQNIQKLPEIKSTLKLNDPSTTTFTVPPTTIKPSTTTTVSTTTTIASTSSTESTTTQTAPTSTTSLATNPTTQSTTTNTPFKNTTHRPPPQMVASSNKAC